MPGLFGAVLSKDHRNELPVLIENMSQSLNHNGKLVVHKICDISGGYGCGRVSLGVLNPVPQPVANETGNLWIIFHGELADNHGGLSDPEYVLDQYMRYGDSCAADLEGMYHFVIFNSDRNEMKIFSDKFGLYPIYYSLPGNNFIFGAEVKALLASDLVDKTPDYAAMGDFFHYGQILGNKTLFEHVKLVPPGSVLTCHLDTFSCTIEPYWQLDSIFAEHGRYDTGLSPDTAVDLLCESIQKSCKNPDMLGLSLSGGLDSRAILAGLGELASGMQTYTLGIEGCADQKLAERMARISGTNHEFLPLNQLYISDFGGMARDMINFSDGMYHPHESTEMLALQYFRTAKFRILLRGHGGEIAKANLAYPVIVGKEVVTYNQKVSIIDYIFQKTNLVMRDIDMMKLFAPVNREMFMNAPVRSLQESCGHVAKILAPADVCIYYYINEHIRRQVVASLDIFRKEIEVRMPYLSSEFLCALLHLPVQERFSGEIHHKLIQKTMPALIKIPNSNTGAPLDAGEFRLFVTDKFVSIMKKMNMPGYRHYTEFQKWYRQGFKEHYEKILFNEMTASRNLYNMDYLSEIYQNHVSGKVNCAHLLGTIIGIELWFRQFVDSVN